MSVSMRHQRSEPKANSCSKNSRFHTSELAGAGAVSIESAGVGMQSTSATTCDSVSGEGSR
jgi:hypothetical protein